VKSPPPTSKKTPLLADSPVQFSSSPFELRSQIPRNPPPRRDSVGSHLYFWVRPWQPSFFLVDSEDTIPSPDLPSRPLLSRTKLGCFSSISRIRAPLSSFSFISVHLHFSSLYTSLFLAFRLDYSIDDTLLGQSDWNLRPLTESVFFSSAANYDDSAPPSRRSVFYPLDRKRPDLLHTSPYSCFAQ